MFDSKSGPQQRWVWVADTSGVKMDESRQPVIAGAARTPVGRLLGSLASRSASELGGVAIAAALDRAGVGPIRSST